MRPRSPIPPARLLPIFLLLLAAPAALGGPARPAALEQRLGVSEVSVQSLRFTAPDPTFTIDLGGRTVTLRLERRSLDAPGFRVLVDRGDGALHEVAVPEITTLHGTVPEIPGSVVGGTLRNGQLNAAIALGDGRVFFVQPLPEIEPGAASDLHAVYDGTDLLADGGTCATDEPQVVVPPASAPERGNAVTAIKTAEIAFDADFEFFTYNIGNVTETVADIRRVLTEVNVVYERDVQITHYLTGIVIRTAEPDPYTSTDAGTMLNEFRNSWNASQTGVPRDVAHLMTGKEIDGGTIGIANVGAVCNRTRAYGLSQSHFSSNMARRCALTAHELGHNWNAVHCDGASPCNIMCASINGCNGIGLPNFEPMGITAITNFAASRTCLGAPVSVDAVAGGAVRLAAGPSPFSTETGVSFYLERPGSAELDIYDVAGHRVARLAEGSHEAGWHRLAWAGLDPSGRRLRAGVYYARLRAAGGTVTRTLVMLQ